MVYKADLIAELRLRVIPFARQQPIPIVFRGVDVGSHGLDLPKDDLNGVASDPDLPFPTTCHSSTSMVDSPPNGAPMNPCHIHPELPW